MSVTSKVKGRAWISPARREKITKLSIYACIWLIALGVAVYMVIASWYMYHELLLAHIKNDVNGMKATRLGFISFGTVFTIAGIVMLITTVKFADTWRGIEKNKR